MQPARHSKLERADILEMTVQHLKNMQCQQVALATATDPTVINKYRAGFSECAGEVGRFPGLEPAVRRRLLQHLAACLGGGTPGAEPDVPGLPPSPPPAATSPPTAPLQLHMVSSETSPPGAPALSGAVNNTSSGFFCTTSGGGPGLQLVPTRLPNGDITLVLPSSRAGQLGQAVAEQQAEAVVKASPSPSSVPATSPFASPLPMLIPIPQRTASTASAISSASASSFVSTSSTSLPAFDRITQSHPHNLSIAFPPSPLSNSSKSCGYEMQTCGADVADAANAMADVAEEQRPLTLVTNCKKYEMEVDDEQPWRPW